MSDRVRYGDSMLSNRSNHRGFDMTKPVIKRPLIRAARSFVRAGTRTLVDDAAPEAVSFNEIRRAGARYGDPQNIEPGLTLAELNRRNRRYWSPEGQRRAALPPSQRDDDPGDPAASSYPGPAQPAPLLGSAVSALAGDEAQPEGRGVLCAMLPKDRFGVTHDSGHWHVHDNSLATRPEDDPNHIAGALEHIARGRSLEGSEHVTDHLSLDVRLRAAERGALRSVNERNRAFWKTPQGQPGVRVRDADPVARGRLVARLDDKRFVHQETADSHRLYDFDPQFEPQHDPEDADNAIAYLAGESGPDFEPIAEQRDMRIMDSAYTSPQQKLAALHRQTHREHAKRWGRG